MFSRSATVMIAALLMFPQIAETIYSPALTSISAGFSVDAEHAAQTLSVYFVGFAVGVLFWGRLCDLRGRRPALLAGLSIYIFGSVMALMVSDFSLLLIARVIAAFGAATGSVVTQTLLRDRFQGHQLARIFSFIGIALAISPAIGVAVGGELASRWGFHGVFLALALLAFVLLAGSLWVVPETRPAQHIDVSFCSVARRMVRDKKIWLAALLVAAFNVSLFSYYSLAPFIFARLHLNAQAFGYSGIALATGSIIGSLVNRSLLSQGARLPLVVIVACLLNIAGSAGVLLLSHTLLFLLPMALVTMAFAMAIPVALGSALSAYADCRGSAGALFGLFYYVLIALGLGLSGWGQALGVTLTVSAVLCAIVVWLYLPLLTEK